MHGRTLFWHLWVRIGLRPWHGHGHGCTVKSGSPESLIDHVPLQKAIEQFALCLRLHTQISNLNFIWYKVQGRMLCEDQRSRSNDHPGQWCAFGNFPLHQPPVSDTFPLKPVSRAVSRAVTPGLRYYNEYFKAWVPLTDWWRRW